MTKFCLIMAFLKKIGPRYQKMVATVNMLMFANKHLSCFGCIFFVFLR